MKVKITTNIYFAKYPWEDEGKFELFSMKLEDTDCRTFVGEQEVEVEVPDDYDPRSQQIAALQRQRGKAMADYQKTVDDINEKISKLQALEYTA